MSLIRNFFVCPTGTFFVIGVVVRKFGVDDALIGTVATTLKLIAQFIFASATSEVVFYLGEWGNVVCQKKTKSVTYIGANMNTGIILYNILVIKIYINMKYH